MASYDLKLEAINAWVNLVNKHWKRLNGVLNNDKDFWKECLHDIPEEVWQAWLDIAPSLSIQYEDEWRTCKWNDIDTIKRRLMKGDPITKKHRKEYNFPAYRALMNIKDFMNKVNCFAVNEKVIISEPTQFEKLFEW